MYVKRYRVADIRQVDPRMRGGDAYQINYPTYSEGRSPHARGRQGGSTHERYIQGSIPACAGETTREDAADLATRVDPRMRGGDRS